MMVGRQVQLTVERKDAQRGEVVLEVRGAKVRDDRGEIAVKGVDLEVHAGEIVAVAGVQGNGQTELVEAMTGLRQIDAGTIMVGGQPIPFDPRRVADMGVAHIPEDRLRDGLVAALHASPRTTSSTPTTASPTAAGSPPPRGRGERAAKTAVKDYDVRTPVDPHGRRLALRAATSRRSSSPASSVGRSSWSSPPSRRAASTSGSIEYIHRRIVEQRDGGAAILIVSTELDEVLALGDRVAVMFAGEIVGVLDRGRGDPRARRPPHGWRSVSRLGALRDYLNVWTILAVLSVIVLVAQSAWLALGIGVAAVAAILALRRTSRGRTFTNRLRLPVLAILSAFIVGGIVLVFSDLEFYAAFGADPLGTLGASVLQVLEAYKALIQGAFGDPTKIIAALGSGDPQALGTALRPDQRDPPGVHAFDPRRSWRRGRLPVGRVQHRSRGPAEGRGDLGAILVGIWVPLPAPFHVLAAIAAGFIGGAL